MQGIERTSGRLENVSDVSIGGRSLFVAANLEDPGYPVVVCSIYGYLTPQALCDLGANVNIISKEMIEKLNCPHLHPTMITL